MRQGARFLQVALPNILGRHLELLSPRMARVIATLSGELRHLNERLDEFTAIRRALRVFRHEVRP